MSRRFLSPSLPAVLVLASLTSACDLDLSGTQPEGPEQVVLQLSVVPDDVRCLRVTATGPGRTVVREMEVAAGASVSRAFSGLPLGPVSFLGEAFTSACSSVTKSTNPTWISEPVEISVVLGRSSTVELTMVRNGRAKLEVAFSEEPLCSGAGAGCLSASECCSRSCVDKRCATPDDAGPPAQ